MDSGQPNYTLACECVIRDNQIAHSHASGETRHPVGFEPAVPAKKKLWRFLISQPDLEVPLNERELAWCPFYLRPVSMGW